MMLTFYSFKNKKNEPEPLIKLPSSIDGQMFDIADCENSTLVVLDRTEQVQMDQLKNCRVFVGACESSMFIRNCDNCTFYTACRQLRLREVTNCTFYIYSMAEVHIEFSWALRFAPFNGGYAEQAAHLSQAKLPVDHNLWCKFRRLSALYSSHSHPTSPPLPSPPSPSPAANAQTTFSTTTTPPRRAPTGACCPPPSTRRPGSPPGPARPPCP